MPQIRDHTPSRLHSLTPYLSCLSAAEAIEWYRTVLGDWLLADPIVMPDGTIGHAELAVGDSVFFLAGEYEVEGVRSPIALGGNSVSLMVYVPDADATIARALDHGAELVRPASHSYGARTGVIRDPFGHRWFVSTHLEADDVPVEDVAGRRYGDIGYLTFRVPDGERAKAFYGALFGWDDSDFHPGHEPGSYHVASITPPAGIHQHDGEPGALVYFRIDDIEASAARVRQLGGKVLSVQDYDSGANPPASTTKASASNCSVPAPATENPQVVDVGSGH